MSAYVQIDFDERSCAARLKARIATAQKALDTQVLRDSNFFVPVKTGTLEKSGIINTVAGSGVVRRVTPYARMQYYGDGFDHSGQANPNACARWFEAAKARYLTNWEKLVNEYI